MKNNEPKQTPPAQEKKTVDDFSNNLIDYNYKSYLREIKIVSDSKKEKAALKEAMLNSLRDEIKKAKPNK